MGEGVGMTKKIYDISLFLAGGELKGGRGCTELALKILAVAGRSLGVKRWIFDPSLVFMAVEVVTGVVVEPGPVRGNGFGPYAEWEMEDTGISCCRL